MTSDFGAIVGAVFGALFGIGVWLAISIDARDWFAHAVAQLAKQLEVDVADVSWMIAGAVGGALLLAGLKGAPAALPGCFVGGAAATFVRQQQAASERKRLLIRQSLLTPAFLDMLAITMSTGSGLRAAMNSLFPKLDAELQVLWRPMAADGEVAVVERLQQVINASDHSPTQRVANALIVSTERGTPIADVLQSLAQEIRAECRRQLLEIASKKDVQMMLPVVFGILPSITAVALFPAVGSLTSLT